jgi:ABC-type transporter Mla MlaB component
MHGGDAGDSSMAFELQATADGVNLVLAGRLGVQQARPLWDALQPAIAANQSIRVQASGLDEMDTSITQILCRLSSRSGQFQIGEISDGFVTALKGRGLAKFFVHPSAAFVLPSAELETQILKTQIPEHVETKLDTLAKAARQGHG